MFDIPLYLNFNVISAGLGCEISSHEGVYKREERLWLTLRGQPRSRGQLILSTGEDVCDLDVHLYLTNTRPAEMNADLSSTEVGFLVNTRHIGNNELPFIHGSLAWLDSPLPIYLINPGLSQSIRLEFIPMQPENSKWETNKQNRLQIINAVIEMTSMVGD